MGVTLGTLYATGATGWSTFDSPSHILYVADSSAIDGHVGNDSTAVVDDITKPWKTTNAAYLQAVNNYNGTPVWILLKQGDTFADQNFGDDLESAFRIHGATNNPAVVSSYHPSYISGGVPLVNPASGVARPLIKVPCCTSGISGASNSSAEWYAVVGLNFLSYRAVPTDTANYSKALASVSINSGGSGYAVNDVLRLTGSNGTTFQAAAYHVSSVSGGVITSVGTHQGIFGAYKFSDTPTAFTSTGGSGSGATFNLPVYTDPNSNTTGLWFAGPSTWNLAEDCRFSYFSNSINPSPPSGFVRNSNSRIRRCQIDNAYAQGVDGASAPLYIDECVIYNCGGGFALNHNIYTDGHRRFGDCDFTDTPVIARGNILAVGSGGELFRTGALVDNNCSIANQGEFVMGAVGLFSPDVTTDKTAMYNPSITNNVWVEGVSRNITDGVRAINPMGTAYKGVERNAGTTTVTGNIMTKSISVGSGINTQDINGWTVSNNIIYKWGTVGSEILTDSGVILDVAIQSSGSYTAKSTNISAATRESTPATNDIILTVGSTASLNALDVGCSSIWITGLSGGFASSLNDKMFLCGVLDSTHIVLFNTGSVAGSYSSGGTAYLPYNGMKIDRITGSGGPTSGSQQPQVDIIVGPSGHVVATYFGGSSGLVEDNFFDLYGVGFAVNDTFNSAALDTAASGSGFVGRVAHLMTNTIGSNVLDAAGATSASYPDPERTSGTYYNSLFGGSGATYADFIPVALANNKANWDSRLTANALNIYIRAGFGIGSDTTPPVLMAQICM